MVTPAEQSNPYIKAALHLLDWVPVVNTVKTLTGIFIQRCWKPDPAQLSPAKRTFYEHINEKPLAYNLLIAIPFLGNFLAIVRDIGIIREKIRESSDEREFNDLLNGSKRFDAEAVSKILNQPPALKEKSIEACFTAALSKAYMNAKNSQNTLAEIMRIGQPPDKQKVEDWLLQNLPRLGLDACTDLCLKPEIPQSVRHKYIELAVSAEVARTDVMANHYLSRFWDQTDAATRTFILLTWQNKANEGNERAWNRLERMYESHGADANTKTLLFAWFLRTAENFSSPHNSKAWSLLRTLCGYFASSAKSDEIIQFYIRVAQMQGVPSARANYLDDELERFVEYGRTEQRSNILTYWARVAATGDIGKLYQLGKFYCENNQRADGLPLLERAANADHLPSIMYLGNLHYFGREMERAAFWYEKAGNRDAVAGIRLNYIRSSQDTSRRREEANRAREEHERDRAQHRQQRQERMNSERTQEEARARARAEARARQQTEERNQRMAELKGHIGEFSSIGTLNSLFKRWALRNHPDKHGNDATKAEIFKRVVALVEIFRTEYERQAA